MIAIQTKYLGPTNFKGSRIKAFTSMGAQLTIGYPHELSGAACHVKAAVALAKEQGWTYGGKLISGGVKGGYVFVFSNAESFDI